MEDQFVRNVQHRFVIRVWRETDCRKPAEWRIRVHHVNSGDVFYSTDVDQALDHMKETVGLPDNVAC